MIGHDSARTVMIIVVTDVFWWKSFLPLRSSQLLRLKLKLELEL